METYMMWPSVAGFCHYAWHFQDSSMLKHASALHSVLRWLGHLKQNQREGHNSVFQRIAVSSICFVENYMNLDIIVTWPKIVTCTFSLCLVFVFSS
jgi:hypothetical protein